MTRMQIIAKAVLASLGIYCIVQFCKHFSIVTFDLFDNCSFAAAMIGACICMVYIISLLYLLVLRNNRLAIRMAGPGEVLSPASQRLWLIASLRAGAVFCGIILLANSTEFLGGGVLLTLWRLNLRQWISQTFTSVDFGGLVEYFFRRWSDSLFDFLKAVLAIYLICGAPQFVHWQLKTTVKTERNNISNIKSEGAQNE